MKKIGKIIINIVFGLFVGLSSIVIIIGISANLRGVPPSIFGVSFSVVPTNSMEPTIMTGDTIVFKSEDYQSILDNIVDETDVLISERTNPIIIFKVGNMFVVHRAVRVQNGLIITQGDNNPSVDPFDVNESNVYGVYSHTINGFDIGTIIVNYRNIIFMVISIILSFILIKKIINVVKIWKEAERKRLLEKSQDSDNEKLEALLAETEELKRQLSEKKKE